MAALADDLRMCYGKKAYSYGRAMQMLEKRGEHQAGLRIYACPVCHRWHLTKSRPRDGRG